MIVRRNKMTQLGEIPLEIDMYGLDQHDPGAKLDAGKPELDLLLDFGMALMEVGKVCTYGRKKYSKAGWLQVKDGEARYTAALLRHLLKENYEECDADTDLLHAAHGAWNSLARLEKMLRKKGNINV